jgi:hypothetical protein
MHEHVLDALHWLLGQLQVPGFDVAAAPLRLHLLDAPVAGAHAQQWLPFIKEFRQQRLQLLAIPALQEQFSIFG